MAAELEELYGEIEGLEYYVGLLMEKRREKAMFGESIVEMGGPYSVKGNQTHTYNTLSLIQTKMRTKINRQIHIHK